MNTEHQPELGPVLIRLLKGVLYQERYPSQWQDLVRLQGPVRDYFKLIGLTLVIDEAEQYAFLRQDSEAGEAGDESLPRLVQRRPLGYPVSLLLVLLRKKLIELDAGGGETRLILSRAQIVDMLRVFLPESSNEAKIIDQIDRYINKLADYGFLRRLKGSSGQFEVHRIIKALVDSDWLSDFAARLTEYQEHASR
ncbi:MAG: DUF4194 domain-containing protein [Desulfobacterales bacterium]|nr:DUF4194 domain-containing protein [Desulfobacterales bacterium]